MAGLARLAELARRYYGYYDEFVEALEDYEAGRERVYAVEGLAQLVARVILDYAAVLASRERGVKPEAYGGAGALARQAPRPRRRARGLLGGSRRLPKHPCTHVRRHR